MLVDFIEKPLIKTALFDAYYFHSGQLDKQDVPVIFHLYDVANMFYERYKHIEYACYTNIDILNIEHVVCVALLHEILVNETGCTMEFLSKRYPEIIVDAVSVISRKPEEDYLEYIKRASTNEIVKHVLICDLMHNLNKTFKGFECDEKYETYLAALKMINN